MEPHMCYNLTWVYTHEYRVRGAEGQRGTQPSGHSKHGAKQPSAKDR